MSSGRRLSVLLCTEGTYPYVGGGVSTWCDNLCRRLEEVDWSLFAVTGTPEVELKYPPPDNVRRIVHVPLWGTREPAEVLRPDERITEVRRAKRTTTEAAVAEGFVPLLRELLAAMEDEARSASPAPVVHAMWRWFRAHDWIETWRARSVWDAWCEHVDLHHRGGELLPHEQPSMFDLTTCLRWLRNFLTPLAAPLPVTDVVHTSIAAFAGLAGVVAKQERGTPFIATDHGVYVRERYIAVSEDSFPPFSKRFLVRLAALVARLVYASADVVAPVADFNRRWEVPYGADPAKIETIYNGVDPEVFVPAPKPAKTSDRPTVVAAARVFPLKDIEMMIRAAAVARRELPSVQFLVYGNLDADPPYVERCRRLIAELGLEENFTLAGFHPAPAEVYTEGDISALSSISEGFPFTVLESMSCARPVVGTDVGGVREALEGFGRVVPPRDHEAFGAACVELLRDDEARLELGRRAREQILLRFRTSTSVDGYRALYSRLAGGGVTAG